MLESCWSGVLPSPEMPALCHVEDEQPGIAAYLPDGALSPRGIARADVYGQACVRELAGNLLADSLVGTGDERDQVVHAVEIT